MFLKRIKNYPELVKPNFHYITHLFRIIRDFGPVYALLLERLSEKAVVEGLTPEEKCGTDCARMILATNSDDRGILAAMTSEFESISTERTKSYMGLAVNKDLPPKRQREFDYYNL
ncbi:hypothetical protein C8J57DRAFT_1214700 [Mycena rebaudengoi]|nr:hypothetical protein C8J57DRAFT_1214700 [Mycena rebaudengoi]